MANADELLDYIRKSIWAREHAKFEFTKIIDAILKRLFKPDDIKSQLTMHHIY